MTRCTFDDCDAPAYRARMCRAHYAAWRLTRERPKARTDCACCGRAGHIAAWGLRDACYMKRRRAGKLEEWRTYYASR